MSAEGTQAIRTWTLKASSQSYEQCAPYLEPGPTLAAGEKVEVIELEPVLDLLSEWFESRPLRRMDNVDGKALDRRTVSLLREHGRLV